MEVRIGVVHSLKELELELDSTPEEVTKALDAAFKAENGVLWLTDSKGRRVGVPAERVAYVEVEADHDTKHVGFGPG